MGTSRESEGSVDLTAWVTEGLIVRPQDLKGLKD